MAKNLSTSPSKTIHFNFNGRPLEGKESDTIGSALWSQDIKIFGRSFKFHRPRGPTCFVGNCPNCLMEVNGVPNVRTCIRELKEGDEVISRNGWPSIDHDLFSSLDHTGNRFRAGFQYYRFMKPKIMRGQYDRIFRNMGGIGHLGRPKVDVGFRNEERECDVAVVGGGPAGIKAAEVCANNGLNVILIDEGPSSKLGGHLVARTIKKKTETYGMKSGQELVQILTSRAQSFQNISLYRGSTAFGLYEGSVLGVYSESQSLAAKIIPKLVIAATGSIERMIPFVNSDLPGVFLSTGAELLTTIRKTKVGEQVVIFSSNEYGLEVALELAEAGTHVAAVVFTRDESQVNEALRESLKTICVRLFFNSVVTKASGTKRLRSVIIRDKEGTQVKIEADALCVSGGFVPRNEILFHADAPMKYFARTDGSCGWIPDVTRPNTSFVLACGDVAGITKDFDVLENMGEITGLSALMTLLKAEGRSMDDLEETIASRKKLVGDQFPSNVEGIDVNQMSYSENEKGGKNILCLCEDVMQEDIAMSVADGFDYVETLKRYTGFTMGPCQGKYCLVNCMNEFSKVMRVSPSSLKPPTFRPPIRPVPIGAISTSKNESQGREQP